MTVLCCSLVNRALVSEIAPHHCALACDKETLIKAIANGIDVEFYWCITSDIMNEEDAS